MPNGPKYLVFKSFLEVYALLKEISCGQCDWQPCIFVQCATPGFVGQMQSTLQDVVCRYCSRPAMHCEKNEFPPQPDELGNFPSQFFKKWTCRNLVTTLLPLFSPLASSSEYVINWQQSFTFIISIMHRYSETNGCVLLDFLVWNKKLFLEKEGLFSMNGECGRDRICSRW